MVVDGSGKPAAGPFDIVVEGDVITQIAGVEVHYDGKGIVGDTQRPGILARLFKFLF